MFWQQQGNVDLFSLLGQRAIGVMLFFQHFGPALNCTRVSFCPSGAAARPALPSGLDLSRAEPSVRRSRVDHPPSQQQPHTQVLIHGRLRRSHHTKPSHPNLSACLEISLCIYVAVLVHNRGLLYTWSQQRHKGCIDRF